MYDKIIYKVDGGTETRDKIPRLSRPFKQPKTIVIGSTGQGRFEGCISGVKITNWPSRKVKLATVEPIKWSEYDFTHAKEIQKVGIARDKCGPEPQVPPIPTRPIPGPHGPTTPPPGPPGGPEKGKRKVADENTAIIGIVVLLIILIIIAVLVLLYWYYAKHKGVYHTHEDDDQAKASEPFIDLQPIAATSSAAAEEPQKKQEWYI
jgi:contactin associated protein-like 2